MVSWSMAVSDVMDTSSSWSVTATEAVQVLVYTVIAMKAERANARNQLLSPAIRFDAVIVSQRET